eukprot:COSAG02_NODE_1166_length_14154_cov_19.442191_5_plen_179_part_00
MQGAAQAAFDSALALIQGAGKWSSSWWGGMLPQSTAAKTPAPSAPDLVIGRYVKPNNPQNVSMDLLDGVCRAILTPLWFLNRSTGTGSVGHVHYCNVTMRSWITAGQNDSNTLQILAPGFSSTKPGVKGPSNTHAQNNTIAAFLLARGRNTVLSFLPNENGWSLASDYGATEWLFSIR